MSHLERSLSQHGIEISGWLLHPSGRPEEEAPDADESGTGDRLRDYISPPELLPNTLGAALQWFAEGLGDPTDAYYLVLLCVAASLIPSKTRLLVDPRSEFSVPPILWGGLMECYDSGYRIINTLTRPLKDLQAEYHARHQQQSEEFRTALRAYWEEQKRGLAGDRPDPPDPIELWTSECRADMVGRILDSQPDRGLLIVPNNLVTFLQESGAWPLGRRSDRILWRGVYSGSLPKRSTRTTFCSFTTHPSVSVIGGIHHHPLPIAWTKSTQTGSDLWPCFAWVEVPPNSRIATQEILPHGLRLLLEVVYRRLQASPPMQHVLDEEGQHLWSEWKSGGMDHFLREADYKIRVLLFETLERAARIALVLHRLDAACIGVIPSVIVPARTLDRGIEFAMCLYCQAETSLLTAGGHRER